MHSDAMPAKGGPTARTCASLRFCEPAIFTPRLTSSACGVGASPVQVLRFVFLVDLAIGVVLATALVTVSEH